MQTATKELMVAVTEFRDDLADKSLSVAVELIEARQHAGHGDNSEEYALFGPGKSRPSGDELLQGTSAVLTGASVAIRSVGGPWGTVAGTILGAAGLGAHHQREEQNCRER